MQAYSLYIHIPFCQRRCSYCDFNTYAGMDNRIPDYVTALCQEIQLLGKTCPEKIALKSIYFGGGTPSFLDPGYIDSILDSVRNSFEINPDCEISLEANPGTINQEKLFLLRSSGINRISLGVQSIHAGELRIMNRIHDTFDTINSVVWIRDAGFDNFNLDLIYGIPGQTIQSWQTTLEFILRLDPNHISLYSLTIEEGTRLNQWVDRGLLDPSDNDLAADMYLLAEDILNQADYRHYEISNWALPRTEGKNIESNTNRKTTYACLHNLQYWHNMPYLGVGAGAHGYAAGYRLSNEYHIDTYIARMSNPAEDIKFPQTQATNHVIPIPPDDEIQETMMVGLRLTQEGVSENQFFQRFNQRMDVRFHKQIEKLVCAGLLEWKIQQNGRTLVLTKKGRLLGNQVFMEFLQV